MPIEKERKFLLKNDSWRNSISCSDVIVQGYLSLAPERTVRIRILNDKGFLTVKGISKGDSRLEYEYEIPYEHASQLLENLCIKPLLKKKRHTVYESGFVIDEFLEDHEGLFIAEFEYSETNTDIDVFPDWIGLEVTGNKNYYNSMLCSGDSPPALT